MSRPLRVEFPGATYHVTARGNARMPIVLDDLDRLGWLDLVGEVVDGYGLVCYGYCLMGNHFHLLVETPRANLGRAMQRLCSQHALAFNRRHRRVGHLFQGRYGAVIVERDAHLAELTRYLGLNPVRGQLCAYPELWRWSSYPALVGVQSPPSFLAVAAVLALFGDEPEVARRRLAEFVADPEALDPFRALRGRTYLGSEEFAREMSPGTAARDVARVEWQPIRPSLEVLFESHDTTALTIAHREFGYTLGEIAEHLGVHRTTVGRRLGRVEQSVHQRSL